jgi:tetratricopeptide (TPR) repeat protein
MRLAALLLALAAPALAQPASDLLQSGIFDQETTGDLDSAIRTYRQILSSSADLHLYAAQAQYRLGVCLLRKGDTAGAIDAFQTLIRKYPDEHELLARARENMPQAGGLLPAPWPQTEVAEYRWNIPNVDDGWSLTRIAPAPGGKYLRIQLNIYSPRLYSSMVDVDPASMRPAQATYRPPSQPVLHGATSLRDGVLVRTRSAGSLRATPDPPDSPALRRTAPPQFYEYGEVLYLLRRMPLYSGWTATVPVIAPDGARAELNASVTAMETVTVAAGTFRCFKVHLSTDPKTTQPKYSAPGADWQPTAAGQTLWYAVDGARPLVKMQVGNYTGELTNLRTGAQLSATTFHDPQIGLSFTVPAGWIYHSRTAVNGPATSIDLLDPELQVMVVISFKSKTTAAANIEAELLAGLADTQNERLALTTKGELEHSKIGGHPSLTWIGERPGPDGRVVRITTWIQSESTRGSIAASMPAADLDRFRARIQPVLNSFRMP